MAGRIPWGRVLAEGAVIVVSILLAFSIDAWWARLGERSQERVALDGLEADFTGYLEILEGVRASNERRAAAARVLVGLAGPHPSGVDEDEVHGLLGQIVIYRSIILPAGTLGSLLETDGLSLISDPAVRLELVAWTRVLDLAGERNDYLVEQARELDAFLKPRYPMDGILRRAEAQILEVPLDEAMTETRFPARVASLLSDQEFANHIAFAEDASVLLIDSVDQLAEEAARVLALVRAGRESGSKEDSVPGPRGSSMTAPSSLARLATGVGA